MNDPFDLQRFLAAQNPVWESVLAELRKGSKRGHWVWFVFPQLKGLGRSSTADYYGISSREEAEAYLSHPILGTRLIDSTQLINSHESRSAEAIFGGLDAMKFRSSITLFREIAPEQETFANAMKKYFGGKPDQLTLSLLGSTRGTT